MFVTEPIRRRGRRVFAIKPMNCPGHVQIFKHGLKSYRDLPIRLAEFGNVHRYEPSGALHGLMRVRGFTQDDAHVFCTEEQLRGECMKINDLILSVYADFGFDEIVGQTVHPAGKARWLRRGLGSCRADHVGSAGQIEAQSGGRIKTAHQPGRGRVLRSEVRVHPARRHWP
jgi:threonyl-tRNA synthetase